MKNIFLTTAITIALTSPAFANINVSGGKQPISVEVVVAQADVQYSNGKIKKINKKAGKVIKITGPLFNSINALLTTPYSHSACLVCAF